jgi:hypothetical protein
MKKMSDNEKRQIFAEKENPILRQTFEKHRNIFETS